MNFTSGYDTHNFPNEKLSNESLVETAGYIPAQVRIENLINAGQRLQESRANEYDLQDGIESDDFVPDPTRQRNYDLADATQDLADANERIKSRKVSTKVDTKTVKEPEKNPDKNPASQDKQESVDK